MFFAGSVITHVNGMSLANWTFNSAVRAIQTQARPLTIQVVNPPAEPEPEPESVRISKSIFLLHEEESMRCS